MERYTIQQRIDIIQKLYRSLESVSISVTSLWRILRKDFGLHPYKVKLTQDLKQRRLMNFVRIST